MAALQAREAEREKERKLLGLAIINAGYKALAAKHHPDLDGSHEVMSRLQAATAYERRREAAWCPRVRRRVDQNRL